jgi:serine/threonine-protein kinase
MGSVYAARNTITDEHRALKIIRADLAADEGFRLRFVREIKASIALNHPNVVRVFEPGQHEDTIYLPMELLDGENLMQRLKRGPYAVGEAVTFGAGIAEGLGAIHAAALVHRDIKPSNVFLARVGTTLVPKLLDLGAVKRLGTDDEATRAGGAIGTEPYMSPEQARGATDIDGRSDQFGFGVLLYEMLTGARPWERDDSSGIAAKILMGAPFKRPREILPSLPESVEKVILRCLMHDRDKRYPSMKDVARALRAIQNDDVAMDSTRALPVEPRPKSVQEAISTSAPMVRARTPAKGKGSVVAIAVSVASVLIAAGATAAWLHGQTSAKQAAPPVTEPAPATARVPSADQAAAATLTATATAAPVVTPTEIAPSTTTAAIPVAEATTHATASHHAVPTASAKASAAPSATHATGRCVTPEGIPCDL